MTTLTELSHDPLLGILRSRVGKRARKKNGAAKVVEKARPPSKLNHMGRSTPAAVPPNPPRKGAAQGTYYGPFFIADWMTTGSYGTTTQRAGSTIYYTLDTFSPYGQVILKSTLEGGTLSLPPGKPGKPPCHGTTCM